MMQDGSFFFSPQGKVKTKHRKPHQGHRERVLLGFQDQQENNLRIKEKSESRKDVDECAHGMGIPESSARYEHHYPGLFQQAPAERAVNITHGGVSSRLSIKG